MVYCSVPQCRTYSTEPGVSFHAYPKTKKQRDAWLIKLRMGKQPSIHYRVCSKHFREDFVYCVGAKMFGKYYVRLSVTVHIGIYDVYSRQVGKDGAWFPKQCRRKTFLFGPWTVQNNAATLGTRAARVTLSRCCSFTLHIRTWSAS